MEASNDHYNDNNILKNWCNDNIEPYHNHYCNDNEDAYNRVLTNNTAGHV